MTYIKSIMIHCHINNIMEPYKHLRKRLKAIAGPEFRLVPFPQALNCLRHFICHWTHQVFGNICPKLCKHHQISLQSPNLYVLIQLRIELTKPQMHRPIFSCRNCYRWAAEALAVSNPLSFLYSFGPEATQFSDVQRAFCKGTVILCSFQCALLVLLKNYMENGKIHGKSMENPWKSMKILTCGIVWQCQRPQLPSKAVPPYPFLATLRDGDKTETALSMVARWLFQTLPYEQGS